MEIAKAITKHVLEDKVQKLEGVDLDSIYLRVILNSLCNAKCYFCHEEGQSVISDLPAEILRQAAIDSSELGIKRIKYTGGEPLLRKDLADLTAMIKSVDPEIEISMTTNGIGIERKIDQLVDAGLDRINVSLHSVDRENYKRIFRVDALDKVLRGLDYAKDSGLKAIKINATVSRYNLHEIFEIAKYSQQMGFEFRIHYLLPSNEEAAQTIVPRSELNRYLKDHSDRLETIERHGKETTRYHQGELTVDVKKGNFAGKCKRCDYLSRCNEGIYALRLTPEGKLRPCLYLDSLEMNFANAIKEGNSKEVMKEAYRRVIK
ncbi:radical SAM protein [Candidatus Woesearchaeota archaeon]|jgi:GTP 3',8-cyclase|nr:radical SAM protein [Candidatus Woesearchaeota archaeon]MBT5272382.1 radical SAM protein [Candidatus Woesearchaeota archaeon]MBT6040993.1 radical SAM protein [Candidatus Woesearchaeota archaeon]MBT6336654.1 radical SAM protein [Candidatus Woesearchaeota archaeon]MBT7927544.1 radical SAM protein [Candidatus Woesearchaeota archaeon]